MGDREHEKGNQKMPKCEDFGKLLVGSAQKMTRSPSGEDGADENPSLPPLNPRDDQGPQPQQQPSTQAGGEEGDPVRQEMGCLISQVPRIMVHIRAELDELLKETDTMPPASTGMPSSSPQMNLAWEADSTQMEDQPAATAGQLGAAATVALRSGHPQSPTDSGIIVQCTACHNNTHAESRCLVCCKETAALTIDPRQPQPQHPPQHLAAPTNQLDVMTLQKLNWNPFDPWLPPDKVGRHHHLQVPEHQRCPSCCYYPGLLVAEPTQHICLCDLCRLLPFLCPFC